MLKIKFIIAISLLCLISCSDDPDPADKRPCDSVELDDLQYHGLLGELPVDFVAASVEEPDEFGALGRNKNGYFHVRFQLPMTRLTDYAVRKHNLDGAKAFLKNLEYSFNYQNPAGDFQFIAPDELVNTPEYEPPTSGDLASGTAFFAYGLGLSLMTLSESDWINASADNKALWQQIKSFDSESEAVLTWLKSKTDLLNSTDAHAPNRLFFDAIAFYSLGNYFNDEGAMATGLDFAERALAQRNEEDGYFIEGGGWDSSYNGVAIMLGSELYTLLDDTSPLRSKLGQAITCATYWQQSRILPTGEISTEGNTRVYPGGEGFVGTEKTVDAYKTIRAFFYLSSLSDDPSFTTLGLKVLDFYD